MIKQIKPQVDQYNDDSQEFLLRCLVADTDSFGRCRNIVKEDYFTDHLRPAVRYILSYSEEFKAIPPTALITAKTGISIEPFVDDSKQHKNWFLKEVEGFCRHKALELVIIDGIDLIQTGRGAEVEQRIKDAMMISLVSELGLDYFSDPKARLERMKDKSPFISTGWELLDKKLYGGFARGTLNIFAGGSGCVVAGTKIKVIRYGNLDDIGVVQEINIEELEDVNKGLHYWCLSPDGWVPIEQWRNKGNQRVIEVFADNGKQITASEDHLFQKSNGEWCSTIDLMIGDELLSDNKSYMITKIRDAGIQVVYDIGVGHKNQRYYSNGFVSHNSGKSLFLQNIALNWSFMGLNVLYISLELSEDMIGLRLDAMVSGSGTSEIFKKVDDVAQVITEKSVKAGKLFVKKLPEGGTTANDLRAYLKEFETRSGVKVDAIVVDYLDLLYPNNERIDPSDLFTKDKFTSEELRGLVAENDLLCATASQLNRDSVEAKGKYEHNHIAGGISKINTCDNLFAIFAPSHMKEKGKMQLIFLKTRTSSAVGQRIDLAYNPVSMLISNAIVVEASSAEAVRTSISRTSQRTFVKANEGKTVDSVVEKTFAEPEQQPNNSTLDMISKMRNTLSKKNGR